MSPLQMCLQHMHRAGSAYMEEKILTYSNSFFKAIHANILRSRNKQCRNNVKMIPNGKAAFLI